MRIVWISVAMSDKGAFHLGLANAALEIARNGDYCDPVENPEAMKYYTKALALVNSRLVDPTLATSEGIIGAIVGFCCHDVSSQLPDRSWF